MVMNLVGFRPEKDCTGEAQQQLKITDPTSRQRGHLTSTNPELSEIVLKKEGEKLIAGSRSVPDIKTD
jgi:hypothetical protein